MDFLKKAWDKIKGFVVGVDHALVLAIEVMRHEFTGEQVRAAIDKTLEGVDKFATEGLDEYAAAVKNTQRTEWVVGELCLIPGVTPTTARALAASAVLWIEKGVHKLITAVDAHYDKVASEQQPGDAPQQ